MSDLQTHESFECSEQMTQTLTYGQTGLSPQFILFGDSITQGATLTVQAQLQTVYIRQLDVVNRGFSGYNTTLALQSLHSFLPLSISKPGPNQPHIQLLTIFFGANDSCLPGYPQHVSLPLYVANLRRIIEYSVFQRHKTKIILVTPAPMNEWQLSKPLNRTAARAKLYADAVRNLAKELDLPCVDLWTKFITLACHDAALIDKQETITNYNISSSCGSKTGGFPDLETKCSTDTEVGSKEYPTLPGSLSAPANEILPTLLEDGLHFAPRGYEVFFDELMQVIKSDIPEYAPENLPWCFRNWRDILNQPKAAEPTEPTTTDEHESHESGKPEVAETQDNQDESCVEIVTNGIHTDSTEPHESTVKMEGSSTPTDVFTETS